jgi:hypothetical protein
MVEKPIEDWLAEHILSYLLRIAPAEYMPLLRSTPLEQDGSICRRPTDQEHAVWSPGSSDEISS